MIDQNKIYAADGASIRKKFINSHINMFRI